MTSAKDGSDRAFAMVKIQSWKYDSYEITSWSRLRCQNNRMNISFVFNT